MLRPVLAFAMITIALPAANATIALANVTSCGPQTFPASTCAIPATGSGNTIVVGIQLGGGVSTSTTIASVTDNAGNIYMEAGAARSTDTAAGSVVDIWYARNVQAGATTVTVSPGTTVTNAGAVIWEFSGLDATSPLDATAVLNSQSANAVATAATVTTTAASEVVISMAAVAGNVTGISSGNVFISDSALKGDGWAHLITAASGTFAAQWNQSPAGTFASSTASFRAAGSGSTGAFSACDLNQDGLVNVIDVQLATNMYLGLRPCTATIDGPAVCNTLVVQKIQNTALGAACLIANSHTVTLNWTASTTPSVNYNVYRSSVSGGPYIKMTTIPLSALTYVDGTVLAGQTYYYVTTAINSSGESAYSNEAPAAVPFP